jgi:undecaprenyl diphosphate synthase
LLWNLAYTEMFFSDVLWPEFSPAHLNSALEFFAQRERRFGKTSAQLAANADV